MASRFVQQVAKNKSVSKVQVARAKTNVTKKQRPRRIAGIKTSDYIDAVKGKLDRDWETNLLAIFYQ